MLYLLTTSSVKTQRKELKSEFKKITIVRVSPFAAVVTVTNINSLSETINEIASERLFLKRQL